MQYKYINSHCMHINNKNMPPKAATLEVCVKCSISHRGAVFCSHCKSNYHPACFLQIPGAFVGGDGKLYCCKDNVRSCDRCGDLKEEVDGLKKDLHCLRTRLSKVNERCMDVSLADTSELVVRDPDREDDSLERIMQVLRQMRADIAADISCVRSDFCELRESFKMQREAVNDGDDNELADEMDHETGSTDELNEDLGNGATRILLLADSQGRQCSSILSTIMGLRCDVMGLVKPNAGFEEVVQDVVKLSGGFNKKDFVIVIAGTNNVLRNYFLRHIFPGRL